MSNRRYKSTIGKRYRRRGQVKTDTHATLATGGSYPGRFGLRERPDCRKMFGCRAGHIHTSAIAGHDHGVVKRHIFIWFARTCWTKSPTLSNSPSYARALQMHKQYVWAPGKNMQEAIPSLNATGLAVGICRFGHRATDVSIDFVENPCKLLR